MIETTAAQKAEIVALCQRHRVRRLTWLNEPVRTGPDAGEAALLIEFNPADILPLSKLAVMEDEISRILGCKTDLHLYLRELYLGYGPGQSGILYDRSDYMNIPMPKDKIVEFCKRKKIRWRAKLPRPLRESVTNYNYTDVDFLAEFEPDAITGWNIFGMGDELGEILGCSADVHSVGTPETEWGAKMRKIAEAQYERPH